MATAACYSACFDVPLLPTRYQFSAGQFRSLLTREKAPAPLT